MSHQAVRDDHYTMGNNKVYIGKDESDIVTEIHIGLLCFSGFT